MTKCYVTVSTDALHVMLGALPLDLHADLDSDYTALVRWNKSIDGTGLNSNIVTSGGSLPDLC